MADQSEVDTANESASEASTSFGRIAAEYEVFRPGPPREAVAWLFPRRVDTVVDLGAGTGSLSRLLVDLADHVVAVEPDEQMREALRRDARLDVHEGRGEQLPLEAASAAGIVASSSWHWVEPAAGLSEASRVLRPGGVLAAMWTGPDPEGTFMGQAQAALGRSSESGNEVLSGTVSGAFVPQTQSLEIPTAMPFSPVEHERFTWLIPMNADQLIGLLGTLSWIILMNEADRERLFDKARQLLRDGLGVSGPVTVDVDFVCEVYQATRLG